MPCTRTRLLLLALVAPALVAGGVRADDLPRAKPESVGLSAEKIARIDELFETAVKNKQIAGSVVLIARKGQVAHLKAAGFADVEAKKPMATDTIFRLASMTKPVTSVAAMMLVDEGKLRLDDPVSKYIPEFKGQKVLIPGKDGAADKLVDAEREVTVKDLLTHTSGLVYVFPGVPSPLAKRYAEAKINFGFRPTTERIGDNVKRLAALPLAHQPGAAFTYGLNTDVLGRVIEVASGQDLDEFFRERIFGPLRMTDTSFLPPPEKADRVAALYKLGEDGKVVRQEKGAAWSYDGSKNYFSGGAGLFGTASDYARLLLMLQGGGRLGGSRLLKPETVKLMTTNQIGELTVGPLAPTDGFGLGFGVLTERNKGKSPLSVGSYSWGGAFYTTFWVDPQKELAVVMLTQIALPWGDLKLMEELPKRTYEALAE
jgi:CubicO group peptidase (beta-lactamase class C family)